MGPLQLGIFGVASFGMSILSGIAGSGGGFVLTPLGIILGLTPAQMVSTSKINGLAVSIGSLSGLRKYKSKVARRSIMFVVILAVIVGLVVPFIIKAFSNRWYQLSLGILLLLLLPVVYFAHIGRQSYEPTRKQQAVGGTLLAGSLFLQGIFSGGLGTLVNIVLMGFLGQTATEAQITKRWSQLVLNITIILGIFGSGLIVWPAAIVSTVGSLAGASIGSHIAVQKGDTFAVNVFLVLMAASAVVLIAGAV